MNPKESSFWIIAFVLVLVLSYTHFYIRTKEHNLNVQEAVRRCADSFNGEVVQQCADIMIAQKIGLQFERK